MGELSLSSLYRRKNPYEKRAELTGQMAARSGLARPLLAYAMGRDLKGAEQWDEQRDKEVEAGMKDVKDRQDREYAMQMLKSIIEISKKDAHAATKILQEEARRNPNLAPFQGIEFNTETKDDWATITAGDGQAYQVYLPGLPEVSKDPENQDLKSRYIIPVGGPKPKDAPTTRTFQEGSTNVEKEWDSRKGAWVEVGRGPKWDPKSGGGRSRGESDIVRDIRTTASQIASRLGDQSLTEAIVKATIKDPKIQAYINAAKDKDPYIEELKTVLEHYKDEYKRSTGQPWGNETGLKPSGKGAADQAELQGDTVIYNGKKYPLNTDGTVTIDGKRYRVNK